MTSSILTLSLVLSLALGGEEPREADYYPIETLVAPSDVVLEIGGFANLPDGSVLLSIRRGDIYRVEGAEGPPQDVRFTKWVDGLQEPLGLLYLDGWVYCGQRGELSRLRDADGDGRADVIETVADGWEISGNYHEYLFGPTLGPDGGLWVTTNKPFGDEPFGRANWRGFALSCSRTDGSVTPIACGLRSPAGVGTAPWGDVFYTDNQGEWCGASKLSHLEPGDFHGHPWGTFSCKLPAWKYSNPGEAPDGVLMPLMPARIPSFKLPAVWFPYEKMGNSPAGFVWDTSAGAFGPFAGQLFVGDQHHSWVMRVSLEKVNGHWQGACYRFREDFQSGITRLAWGPDGSLLVGETNRGWGSRGSGEYGFQRVRWSGAMPFEIAEMTARPNGFHLRFTAPLDPATAVPASLRLESYTYELHAAYGSDEMDRAHPAIESVLPDPDALGLTLVVPFRKGYVHELHADGLRAADGRKLLHPEAYYTRIE